MTAAHIFTVTETGGFSCPALPDSDVEVTYVPGWRHAMHPKYGGGYEVDQPTIEAITVTTAGVQVGPMGPAAFSEMFGPQALEDLRNTIWTHEERQANGR